MDTVMPEHGLVIPPHVPPELVRDFNYFAIPPVDGDLHLGWNALHNEPDIFYTPRNGGHWVFTRAEDIKEAYGNLDFFVSTSQNAIPRQQRDIRFSPAEVDPPELDDVRKLLLPRFRPGVIKVMEAASRDLCVSLIEGMKPQGGCEFVTGFAQHMPIRIFLTMMDLPREDAARLLPIAEMQVRNPDPEAASESFAEMAAYLEEKITARESELADDLISALIIGQINNEPINRAEIISICLNLMFAGLDTVVSAMSFFMRFLGTHPEHRRQLVETPSLIPSAVEELLRYHGVTNLARSAAKDQTYKGIMMKAGEQILLPTVLFGLDERRFSNPLTIDFIRQDNTHLIFGGGAHRCPGSHLARMELRIMLEEWVARIPEFTVCKDGGSITQSGKVNAMKHLPLRWPV